MLRDMLHAHVHIQAAAAASMLPSTVLYCAMLAMLALAAITDAVRAVGAFGTCFIDMDNGHSFIYQESYESGLLCSLQALVTSQPAIVLLTVVGQHKGSQIFHQDLPQCSKVPDLDVATFSGRIQVGSCED